MRGTNRAVGVGLWAVLAWVAGASPALAQDGIGTRSSGEIGTQGPMTVERVTSDVVVAPEAKVTRIDERTSTLVGASAGVLHDKTLFVGGAGYWLANGGVENRHLGYGGLVLGWLAPANQYSGFGVRALLGGGRATLPTEVTFVTFPHHPPFGTPPVISTAVLPVRDDFLIVEPEANAYVNLSSRMRLTGGVSYRLISGIHPDMRDRLRGASASAALQIAVGRQ